MSKRVYYLLLIALLFTAASSASASVDVNISGNGEGPKSTVDVKSNYSSSSKITQSDTSTADIIIETNGVKKEYHGSDPSVYISSDDGNNSVTINGNKPDSTAKVTIKNNINITTDSDHQSSSPSASPTPEATLSADENKHEDKEVLTFWEAFKKQIEAFFKFF